jgi:hypothetical protein
VRAVWESVVEPILDTVRPKVIVEIGVRHGNTTAKLLEFASRSDCCVHGVDPAPGEKLDLAGLEERYGDRFIFHEAMSLDALPQIDDMDVVLIDGDHNWYTVYHELKLIEQRASDQERLFPVVLVHDVDWPNGRRDRYANIAVIPEEHRQPARPWGNETVEERVPRTGVRTAIEDFLEATDLGLEFRSAVGFGGVGIVVSKPHLEANEALRCALEHFDSQEWLRWTCGRVDQARRRAAQNVGRLQREKAQIEGNEAELRRRLESLEAELEEARSPAQSQPIDRTR